MTQKTLHCALFVLLLFAALLTPGEALALQVHGEPEGVYVHQMAHVHYIFALGYFLWDLRRSAFTGRGWRYLQLFCLLMICWNGIAFTGHLSGLFLDPHAFEQTDCYFQTRLASPLTTGKYLYFVTKLDHLIYVPALFFLFLGLRSFYRATAKLSGKESR